MKKALLKFITIYALFLLLFLLLKPAFMAIYAGVIQASAGDWWAVVRHGLSMDLCVAAYFTVIPGLLITASLITPARIVGRLLDGYMAVVSVAIAALYVLDFGLYGSWGFRLDMTPMFYIVTSPTAAMASVEWWHWLCGLLGLAAIGGGLFAAYRFTARRLQVTPSADKARRVWQPLVLFLLTGSLALPIRGGVSVATMNLSNVYFSSNQRLNHAAINPVFSLLYSASHQSNFDDQYCFMDDAQAKAIIDALLGRGADLQPDSVATSLLTTSRPNIVMVVLESFSAHLLPSLGGDPVAVGLDSIARDGILFTNFYASSFRTDRGLAAILSSFPGPTSTSLLKYTDKFEHLPSIASQLKQAGYDAAYYYGGDANFTNMQAYLVSSGFSPIISDRDFPLAERESKWGAHDDVVFARALVDLQKQSTNKPHFTVVQTSSSHEPFEVPYSNPRFAGKPRRNAFAFTDSCLTAFVDGLSRLPQWRNTLVVLVPDHYGCWPQEIDDAPQRHHIPLVFTGGALARRGERIDRLASQTDIGASLFAMLGLRWEGIGYSRNIFSAATPQVAVFTEPSLIGIITPTDTVVYDPDADKPILPNAALEPAAKAFMRDLYSNLNSL
jgi:phosphoglycerol transferase MdoB-like AlkP superfamily enzyme